MLFDESNFPELPNIWTTITVNDACENLPVREKIQTNKYLHEGLLAVIDQGADLIGGYTNEINKELSCSLPVIIFGDHTRIIKFVDFPFAAGADGIKVLQPEQFFLPRLFYYFLRAIELPDKGYARHFQYLRTSKIPLPPYYEQKRIADKLDALLARVDACRTHLDRVPDILKRFRQAVLAAAFRGELSERDPLDEPAEALLVRIRAERRRKWEEGLRAKGKDPAKYEYEEPASPDLSNLLELPEGWVWTNLQTLADVRSGVTKGRDLSKFETIELPYLRVANVQAGYLDLHEIKQISIKPEELENYRLQKNDILYTEGGDRDKLGRGTVWKGEIDPCIHQNHIFCARLYLSEVSPEWVSMTGQLEYARNYVNSVASQSVNLASINSTNLKAMPIPLPPVQEQMRIMERVNLLNRQAETIDAAIQISSYRLDKLEQAALSKAFHGEL